MALDDQQLSLFAFLQKSFLDDAPDAARVELHIRMKLSQLAYSRRQDGVGPVGSFGKLLLIRVDPAAVCGRELQVPNVDRSQGTFPHRRLRGAYLQRPQS